VGPFVFLNPGLWWGALTAAVPVLLHLWQRRRPRQLAFSDLRFLEAGQARRARRVALRRWLLLLLRVLAILAIVAAAARPRLAGMARTASGALSVVCVLDASASMQTQEDGGTRFAAAARACDELARALPAGSELQVVLAGPAPRTLLADWLPATLAVGPALAAMAPTDGACDLAAALREAVRWAGSARHTPVEIVLFSDLQRSAVLPDSAALGGAGRALATGGGPRLLVRPVGRETANGGVRAVALPLRAVRAGEALRVVAEVRVEHSPEVCLLEVDGQRVAEAVAQGADGAVTRVEFPLTAPAAGRHRGRVIKRSDRLPVDDERPFTLTVRERLDVLVVHGPDRGEPAGRGGWRCLARALDPGPDDAAAPVPPALFLVRDVVDGTVGAGDLADTDVVCFVDPGPLGPLLAAGLRDWLESGGGALFLLGDPTLAREWAEHLLPGLGLPGRADWTVREAAAQERARVLTPAHPLFAGLGDDALATLQEVRWRRFFTLAEGDSGQVLLALAGGAPLLTERRLGAGRLGVLSADLSPAASDLPLSPMFLPLAQRLVAWLAVPGGEGGGDIVVGETPALRLPRGAMAAELAADPARLRILAPRSFPGERDAPARLVWRGEQPWLAGAPALRCGFHVFTAGADTLGLVAAAPPAAEGDPEVWEPAAFRAALAASAGLPADAVAALPAGRLGSAFAGRDLTPWCLLLALGLLMAESVVSRGGGASRPA